MCLLLDHAYSSQKRKCDSFDINHLLCHPSVDGNRLSVDEVIFFLAEEDAGTGDVFRFSYPPGRMLQVVFRTQRFVIRVLYPAGSDGVYRDVLFSQRSHQRMTQGFVIRVLDPAGSDGVYRDMQSGQ